MRGGRAIRGIQKDKSLENVRLYCRECSRPRLYRARPPRFTAAPHPSISVRPPGVRRHRGGGHGWPGRASCPAILVSETTDCGARPASSCTEMGRGGGPVRIGDESQASCRAQLAATDGAETELAAALGLRTGRRQRG